MSLALAAYLLVLAPLPFGRGLWHSWPSQRMRMRHDLKATALREGWGVDRMVGTLGKPESGPIDRQGRLPAPPQTWSYRLGEKPLNPMSSTYWIRFEYDANGVLRDVGIAPE